MIIAKLEREIRDRINNRRKQHELLLRSDDWNKLCSALDVIGDTELALDSYLAYPAIEEIGLRYVFVYGALQLIQTQQDAVEHICNALRIKTQTSPKLPEIREVRNNSVAHPAQRREDQATKSNFIVRHSLSQHGFELMTVYSDRRTSVHRGIRIPKLIEQQRSALKLVLEELLEKLDEEEMKHRAKHKANKLVDSFPQILGYIFSKIHEAARSASYFPLGKGHVEFVSECLVRMKTSLEARGEWGIYDSVNYEYELIEYPINELRKYFSNPRSSKLNAQDVYIFSHFIENEMKVLQEIAQEIDEEYAKGPTRAKKSDQATKGKSRN